MSFEQNLYMHVPDFRHSRWPLIYMINFFYQNPDHVPVELINGHNAALSGTYKYALGEWDKYILYNAQYIHHHVILFH